VVNTLKIGWGEIMKKSIILISSLILFSVFFTLNTKAAPITNGDFSLGFTGWSQYQDDTFYPNSIFFTIQGITNPYAQVSIDLDLDNDGITDTNAFTCELFQAPNFSAPAGSTLTLSFDWLFDGDLTINPNTDNDIFSVFFEDNTGNTYDANGNPGYLLQTYTYSSTWNHFSTDISYYLNTTNTYYLTFQLKSSLASTGLNYWASHFSLDNVQISITPPSSTVPEPCTLFLLASGFIGIASLKKGVVKERKNQS